MSRLRPLLALIAAAALLSALPVAGADAKRTPSRAAAKHKTIKHKRRAKQRKRARERSRPALVRAGDPIGAISAVDGALVTVTLSRGGSVTAQVTKDTDGACSTGAEPGDEESWDDDDEASIDDEAGDDEAIDDGEDDSDDGWDFRSARVDGGCAPVAGAAVYALVVNGGVYDVLRLTA